MRVAITLAALAALTFAGACTEQVPTSPRLQAGGSPERDFFEIILPNPNDFVEISAGTHHTCARQFKGDVYCWGWNERGQIGTGESDPFGQPQRAACSGFYCVVAPTFVMKGTQVEAGANHTCAVTTTGQPMGTSSAMCWGGGASGELGNGQTSAQDRPVWVDGGHAFRSISAGDRSTCATSVNAVHCWGAMQGSASRPTFLTSSGYVEVAVGASHSCARWVLGTISELHCWGDNTRGQTAQDPALFATPQPVLGTPLGSEVGHVATSGFFTCVDNQQSGTVNCFGENDWAQLGNGTVPGPGMQSWTAVPQTVLLRPSCFKFWCFARQAPLHAVTTGYTHACALDLNGAAYCWGNGADGQLGNGGRSTSAYATPVSGGRTYRAIAAGSTHTCAIGTDNVIYCWGDGMEGQLGTGLFNDGSTIPKPTAPLRAHTAPPHA